MWYHVTFLIIYFKACNHAEGGGTFPVYSVCQPVCRPVTPCLFWWFHHLKSNRNQSETTAMQAPTHIITKTDPSVVKSNGI